MLCCTDLPLEKVIIKLFEGVYFFLLFEAMENLYRFVLHSLGEATSSRDFKSLSTSQTVKLVPDSRKIFLRPSRFCRPQFENH